MEVEMAVGGTQCVAPEMGKECEEIAQEIRAIAELLGAGPDGSDGRWCMAERIVWQLRGEKATATKQTHWRTRVRDEAAELAERISRLHSFLDDDALTKVGPDQYKLLCEQLEVMRKYHELLAKRYGLAAAGAGRLS